MLHRLGRVDALSKLAGGKFVAKDGAELCSSPEEHFLGKEKQAALTGAPNPSEIGTKLNMLLWLSRVDALSKLAGGKFVAKDGAELCSSPEEHFLGKEKQAALTGAPNPSEIGTKLNMLLWLSR